MILSFFVSGCIGVPFGLYICMTLYNKVRNEECREKGLVLQHIIKTYAIIQCITWPLLLFLFGVATFITTNIPILNIIIVTFTRFVFSLYRTYAGFNSLVVATCKYFFIVIEPMADTYDIKRARRILVSLSFVVPIVYSILNEATNIRASFWDKMFGITCNNSFFDSMNTTADANYACDIKTNITMQSPLYKIVNFYCSSQLISVMNAICVIIFIVIRSNVIEGLIYVHIFIHDRR